MSTRRLLLIDNDEDFQRLLHEQLSPYGFEIHHTLPSADALAHVSKVDPVVLFIAVEEPDKLGYSLCNKAKKSVARDLPVVLTTLSVPPSGFQSHRRLKVHADEYIDKRTMSTEELINKVNSLVGLGGQQSDIIEFVGDMDIEEAEEVLVEDIEMSSLAEEIDEDEKTRIAPPDIISDALGEDAVAALTGLRGLHSESEARPPGRYRRRPRSIRIGAHPGPGRGHGIDRRAGSTGRARRRVPRG